MAFRVSLAFPAASVPMASRAILDPRAVLGLSVCVVYKAKLELLDCGVLQVPLGLLVRLDFVARRARRGLSVRSATKGPVAMSALRAKLVIRGHSVPVDHLACLARMARMVLMAPLATSASEAIMARKVFGESMVPLGLKA